MHKLRLEDSSEFRAWQAPSILCSSQAGLHVAFDRDGGVIVGNIVTQWVSVNMFTWRWPQHPEQCTQTVQKDPGLIGMAGHNNMQYCDIILKIKEFNINGKHHSDF